MAERLLTVVCKNPVNLGEPDNLVVPCGKCIFCRIARTREWATRIIHELDSWDNAAFVTLTYDDEHLPADLSIRKDEFQRFMKRIRKDSGRKFKYYACGEYGEKTERPHYHAVIFGLSVCEKALVDANWCKGFTYLGTVTFDSARYVAGYVMKKYGGPMGQKYYGDRQPPFQLVSQGIGKEWLERNLSYVEYNKGVTVRGVPVGLPRYYQKKVKLDFTEERKERRRENVENWENWFSERSLENYDDQWERFVQGKDLLEKTVLAKGQLRAREPGE